MRRPHVSSSGSFRRRLRKKQTGRPHPNGRKSSVPLGAPVCRPHTASTKTMPLRDGELETAAREPMRCAFGAVRVGALLGRVRLHLQTDRFLAVHRGDARWEQACREAGLALAEIVSRMAEAEMDAPLWQAVIPSPSGTDEGSAVAVHDSRTADSSSSAKGGLLGMTIPAADGAVSPVTPPKGAQ